jgi:shikimate kinase
MRVYLVGFMGVGKTTIGYQLSRALNMPFVDIDQYITNKYNTSVQEIFEQQGEAHFREIEKSALYDSFQIPNAVISTGGGTPCFFDNIEQMNKNGMTFYLKLPEDVILNRLSNSMRERPLVKDKSEEELKEIVQNLFESRRSFYEKAHYEVDAANKNALHYITRILSGYMH